MPYTQEMHNLIINQAQLIYLADVKNYHDDPSYYNQKLDRIKSVPIDFVTINAFGLDFGKQIKLITFAFEQNIAQHNPIFFEHYLALKELWEQSQKLNIDII